MVWFQVDDRFALHPKVIEAGNTAMGVWLRAGAWSAYHNTNGFIPAHVAHQIGTRTSCQRLVKLGLFRKTSKGYRFRDCDPTSPTGPSTRPKLTVVTKSASA
jgi:hypothetical protein